MKIYYQYSKVSELTPTKGDFINELNTINALSHFAEVYFNGKRVGNPSETIRIADADFVWVRANEAVFNEAVARNIPCCWMASPYNKQAFKNATFIAAFSKKWQDNLRQGVLNHLNPEGKRYRNAVNIRQTLSDNFMPLAETNRAQQIKNDIGATHLIGCFGRIVKSNYPHLLLDCILELTDKYPGIKFLFGCTNQGLIPDNLPGIVYTNFSYSDMPFALSACDLTFTGAQGVEWDFCGSLKLIEAAACGTPFICAESEARKELYTKDYPFCLPIDTFTLPVTQQKREAFMNMVDVMFHQKALMKKWGAILASRAQKLYSEKSQAKHLETIIKKFV